MNVDIEGVVKKKFISKSGRFAILPLEVAGEYPCYIDIKCFGASVEMAASANKGSFVTATCELGIELVKNKLGEPVMVDGYKKYYPAFSLVGIRERAAPTGATHKDRDGDDPFWVAPEGPRRR